MDGRETTENVILPGGGALALGRRTLVMGVLNVTPDSFFDGGRWLDPEEAAERAQRMAEEGADLIDIGGESTRPNAVGVDEAEELRRVAPALRRIRERLPKTVLSIDTTKAAVARRCLDLGADMINDVSALRFDPDMAAAASESGAALCLMHMLGNPGDMQADPRYEGDVAEEVALFLKERAGAALETGVRRDRILIDPGIGFGKTVEHNLRLLARLDRLTALGFPVLVGVSRKSFIGRILDAAEPADRLEGSLAAAAAAILNGAAVLRVHDVKETARAARLIDAVRSQA